MELDLLYSFYIPSMSNHEELEFSRIKHFVSISRHCHMWVHYDLLVNYVGFTLTSQQHILE